MNDGKPKVLWTGATVRGEPYRIIGRTKRGPKDTSFYNHHAFPILLAIEVARGSTAMGDMIWQLKNGSLAIQIAWDLLKANGLPEWVTQEQEQQT